MIIWVAVVCLRPLLPPGIEMTATTLGSEFLSSFYLQTRRRVDLGRVDRRGAASERSVAEEITCLLIDRKQLL